MCAGGPQQAPEVLLNDIKEQLTIGGTEGVAIGRNIWQHSLKDAIILANAIADLLYGKK